MLATSPTVRSTSDGTCARSGSNGVGAVVLMGGLPAAWARGKRGRNEPALPVKHCRALAPTLGGAAGSDALAGRAVQRSCNPVGELDGVEAAVDVGVPDLVMRHVPGRSRHGVTAGA